MNEQPQCHPGKSQAQTDQELQAEQDEFFLSGAPTSVKLLSSNINNYTTSSLPVLGDVIEKECCLKPITAPTMKAPLKPVKFTKKAPEPVQTEEPTTFNELRRDISRENDDKLAKMSKEEIEALRNEILESVPESFLNSLKKK